MKDRTTGRGRGFGFVVFADASVAEKVVKERHAIDGRIVEAKKAVPRDNHQNFSRNSSSSQGSPSPARAKKIFVGGLASSVTWIDFKRYFDQFGTITDVVVMYDHNTQRPRGFGFITYDSEEAVDRVLFKTFHELNGKMVEVKHAVPKELSPGPTRINPSSSHCLNRVTSILSPYNQGYNSGSSGSYGMRMNGLFSPATGGRREYSPYSPSNYTRDTNLDSVFGLNYDSGLEYRRRMNSYYSGNTDRYCSPNGYDVATAQIKTLLDNTNQSLWGGRSLNYGSNLVTSNTALVGNLERIGEIWGSTGVLTPGSENGSFDAQNIVYGNLENILGGSIAHCGNNDVHNGGLRNFYGDMSFYRDHTWGSSCPKMESSASLGYDHGAPSDATTPNNGVGYVGSCSVNARSNRGIAA